MRVIQVVRFLTVTLLLVAAGAAVGQANNAGPTGPQAILLVVSDIACTVKIDGDKVADLVPDEPKKVAVSLGQHLVSASTLKGQKWSKVVTASNAGQSVVKIEFARATARSTPSVSTRPENRATPQFVESKDGPGIEFVLSETTGLGSGATTGTSVSTTDAKRDERGSTGPKLFVSEPATDVGVVAKGETIHVAFVLKNVGVADLHIKDVMPACRCTTVPMYDMRIKPQNEGKVKLDIDTRAFQGPIEKTALILSDDPTQPQLTLIVKAMIRP